MKNKISKMMGFLLSCFLIITTIASPMKISADVQGNGYDAVNERYHAGLSLQPVGPAFNLKTLMNWNPDDDPDAQLNRSTVPLKERFKGYQINELANPKAKIVNAGIMNANHDTASSVGGSDFNIYAFNHWQYIDSLIYWSGTEEGIFALPTPDVVDAAHRNGVPVYATLGFPWGSGHHDSIEELENMVVQDEDGSFPVADKMIEVAQYYGFDGYFFNQETYGNKEETAIKLNEMLRYMRRKSREIGYPLYINWYDAMSNSGQVVHANAVSEINDLWMKPSADNPENYAVDEFFMNYNWYGSHVENTVEHMRSIGRDEFDAYAGFEIQQNSYYTPMRHINNLIGKDNRAQLSIALYAPNSTMGLAKDPEDFHNHENILYTGPEEDPSLAKDNDLWRGMSRFVVDKSPIIGDRFSTRFVTGHGRQFFVDGKVVRDKEWNQRGIQDVMPTWRWWVKDLEGDRLKARYDFSDAFYGGNSIRFEGNTTEDTINNFMLYSTDLDIKEGSKARLIYKNSGNETLRLGLATSEDYEEIRYFDLPNHTDWSAEEIDLSDLVGQKVYAMSLEVSSSANNKVDVLLGGLDLGQIETVEKTKQDVTIDEALVHSSREIEARLSWDNVEGARHYEVYQRNGKELELLGTTTNTVYFVDSINRTDANAREDNITEILVRPVSESFEKGQFSTVEYKWETDVDYSEATPDEAPVNVALGAEVVKVSGENEAEPAWKMFDGTAKANSKWAYTNASRGFAHIKLKNGPATVRRWRVEHAEFGGEASNMNTISFDLEAFVDGEWKVVKEIRNNKLAVTDVILDEPVTAEEWKLTVHNSGSSPWGAIRIYEWQMFESDERPKPKALVHSQIDYEVNDDNKAVFEFKHIPEDSLVHIYDSLDAEEALETIVVTEENAEKDEVYKNYFGLNVKSKEIDLNAYRDGNSEFAKIYYSHTPKGELESQRNYLLIPLTIEKSLANIHVKNENGEGVNSTFTLTHENGRVYEIGGTSDSGYTGELEKGKYKLVIDSMPAGLKAEDVYHFELKEDREQITIEVLEIKAYSELSKQTYNLGKLEASDYPQKIKEELEALLKENKEVLANASLTETDYQTQLDKVNEFLDKINVDERLWEVHKHLDAFENLDKDVYTKESYEDYEVVIKEAEKALEENSKLTSEFLDKILPELDAAKEALVLKENLRDTKALEALVEEVKDLKEEKYTSETYATFRLAYDHAVKILEEELPSQKDIDSATKDLEEAFEALEYFYNWSSLEKALNELEELNLSEYTEESVSVVKVIEATAKELLDEKILTQEIIDEMSQSLLDAINSLEKKLDYSKLLANLEKARAIDTKAYEEEGIIALSKVMDEAYGVLIEIANRGDLNQEEIDKMVEKLEESIATLVKIEDPIIDDSELDKETETSDKSNSQGSANGQSQGSKNENNGGSKAENTKPDINDSVVDNNRTDDGQVYKSLPSTGFAPNYLPFGASLLGAILLFVEKKNRK